MKSFCVLNTALSAAACANLGSAVTEVMGKKVAVMCDCSPLCAQSAENIAKGVKRCGGCALIIADCFEAQVSFVLRHYEPDCVLFVSSDRQERSSITLYGRSFSVSAAQEDEISRLAFSGEVKGHRGGSIVCPGLSDTYYKELIAFSECFENVGAKIESRNLLVKSALRRAVLSLGGELGGNTVFNLSASGLCMSARDENARVYTHERLMAVCAVYAVKSGEKPELPFALSAMLGDKLIKENPDIRFSFEGGGELWQRDAVFLAAKLMKLMSRNGCGLAQLCSCLPECAVKRRCFTSASDIDRIADYIECDEVLTDSRKIFARAKKGNLLVTACGTSGKYCLEVHAADSETAAEVSDLLDIPD